MSFPPSTNMEAYTNALPPQPHPHHCLTTYSDACWGSQLGNAVCEGIQLPLFKFRSLSSAIIMFSGGPICWKADQQEHTSLSSCEAEIHATNMGSRLTVNTRNMISHLSSLGYPINNATCPTILYNDNDACVKWCHNTVTKGNRHIKNCKNSTHKWVADGTIAVKHVSGKCNVVDYSQKKCKTGPISAAFAICLCVARATSSKVHTILHALLPHMIFQSLHNLLVMCDPQTRVFMTSLSPSLLCIYPQCSLVFLPQVITFSLALLLPHTYRCFWAILWGVVVCRILFTSFHLLDVGT